MNFNYRIGQNTVLSSTEVCSMYTKAWVMLLLCVPYVDHENNKR